MALPDRSRNRDGSRPPARGVPARKPPAARPPAHAQPAASEDVEDEPAEAEAESAPRTGAASRRRPGKVERRGARPQPAAGNQKTILISAVVVLLLLGGFVGYKFSTGNQDYWNAVDTVMDNVKPKEQSASPKDEIAKMKSQVNGLPSFWITDPELKTFHTKLEQMIAATEKAEATKDMQAAGEVFSKLLEMAALGESLEKKYGK